MRLRKTGRGIRGSSWNLSARALARARQKAAIAAFIAKRKRASKKRAFSALKAGWARRRSFNNRERALVRRFSKFGY